MTTRITTGIAECRAPGPGSPLPLAGLARRGVLGLAVAVAAVTATPRESQACSACGCTLSSDWAAQGFATGSGFRLDLRFDVLNQDQLRSGSGTVNRSSITVPNDQEIQQKTINRNVALALDYSPDAAWGVTVLLPFLDRYHTTIAPGDTEISGSDFRRLGDVRIIGRYQGFSPDHTIGVQLGVKLATGAFDENFDSGPQAGTPLDRGLQPGTGTTDLILGVYHYGALGPSWSYFAQATVEQPLGSRDGFKPGEALNVNLGVRWTASRAVVPQIQLNVRAEGRETGPNADTPNSGATLGYLGPGISVDVARGVQAFGFVQVPVYQNVNGYQLEPRYTASFGLHFQL